MRWKSLGLATAVAAALTVTALASGQLQLK
jgi:hypothetical protein